jgi:hypothetical protein
LARAVVSKELVPSWPPNMPAAAKAQLPKTSRQGAAGVYFTACVNRIFGRMPGEGRKPSLQEAMIAVSARAGLPLWLPEDIGGHCCATIWHSKGYREGNSIMAKPHRRKSMALERWQQAPDRLRRQLLLIWDHQRDCGTSDAGEPRAPRATENF